MHNITKKNVVLKPSIKNCCVGQLLSILHSEIRHTPELYFINSSTETNLLNLPVKHDAL